MFYKRIGMRGKRFTKLKNGRKAYMGMKKGKKLIAMFMAALMVIGVLPMDWAADKVSAADATTYIFDASVALNGLEKSDPVPDGTKYADYFTTVGTSKRSNSSTYSLEIAQNSGGAIKFTTAGTADVTITASSTSGTNTSAISLVKADGTVVAEKNGVTTVTGTGGTELKFVDLEAGTYMVVSPENAEFKRGVRILGITVAEIAAAVTTTYEVNCATLDPAVFGVTADSTPVTEGVTFADGYLKSVGGNKFRTKSSTDVSALKAIELLRDAGSSLQFTVNGTADVIIGASSTGGSNESAIELRKADGTAVAEKSGITFVSGTSATELRYEGLTAGTYEIVSPTDAARGRGVRVLSFRADETSGGTRPERAAWDSVTGPELGDISSADGEITVPYTMLIGYDGADKVIVTMKDSAGNVVDTQSSSKDSASGSFTFGPKASGDYTFSITAARENETDKAGTDKSFAGFVLPLVTPSFQSATSKGGGSVELVWNEVTEADSYKVSYSTDGVTYSEPATVVGTSYTVNGLTVGTKYTFKLTAVRTNPAAETAAATIEAQVTDKAQTTWAFAAFGQGASGSSGKCGYTGSVNTDGKVTVWSLSNAGKIVPASTDGLSFYYTAVPKDKNFTLTAKATVDEWTYTNGQEGFGLMAADAVGTHGDSSVFWNNSYMASVTKVEYFAEDDGTVTLDTVKAGTTPSVSGNKVSMKLGVGAQEKTGVTKENLPRLQANDTNTINNEFSSKLTTLEYSCAAMGAGTFDIVGNFTNDKAEFTDTVKDTQTTFDLKIQKNNTGYFVSFTDKNGETVTKKYYDREALEKLDSDFVYAGLFASRSCKVTFSDVNLTTIDPSEDAPAEEQPVTEVAPSFNVTSSTVANTDAYTVKYVSNADGHVVIKNSSGDVIGDADVEANKVYQFETTLVLGDNTFTITAKPNEGFKPSEFEVLSSYEEVTFTKKVTYNYFTGDIIYVGPEGTAKGKGTKESPMDIYTATKFASAGQRIVLLGGTYQLESTVTVQPGIDGTAENMIYMVADPDSETRPVLDFGKNCEGMVFAGDYWYVQGFDVTNSANGKDGIRLSGSHCTFDNMNMYHNGNTGLQISRYVATDAKEDWPAYNLILNCTSYGNADAGYEDADGFAAKLTIGEGNVFDGCIAHHNADDGWDLFAKPETGPIGSVTIQNCVAYANGYLEDGTNAGNGNGFKMGGSSITGYHKLINSVAFDNKAKGIDSNSCPDIQVTKCTSFNNGHLEKREVNGKVEIYSAGSNVAFYTNDAANTDFMASGVLSYRTMYTDIAETFKFKGTQDESKVYNDTNYFWMFGGAGAHNSEGLVNDTFFESVETYRTAVAAANTYTEEEYNTKWVYSANPISRNADNTINMNGLLVVSEAGRAVLGDNVGATVGGTASAVVDLTGSVSDGLFYAPKTGDSANVWLYVFLLAAAVCCAGGCALVAYRKKHTAK